MLLQSPQCYVQNLLNKSLTDISSNKNMLYSTQYDFDYLLLMTFSMHHFIFSYHPILYNRRRKYTPNMLITST